MQFISGGVDGWLGWHGSLCLLALLVAFDVLEPCGTPVPCVVLAVVIVPHSCFPDKVSNCLRTDALINGDDATVGGRRHVCC